MENITTTSAFELVEKIKKGEISSVEVCEVYIDRIKKFDKEVKAWAFFDKKLLLSRLSPTDMVTVLLEYSSGEPIPYMQETELTTITSSLDINELVAFNLSLSISSFTELSFSIKVSDAGT